MEVLSAHVIASTRLSAVGEAGLKISSAKLQLSTEQQISNAKMAKIPREQLCGEEKLLPMAAALGKVPCHHPACTPGDTGTPDR